MQNRERETARYAEARAGNDFATAAVIAGEAVDLIGEILPADEIVERTVRKAERRITAASNRYRVGT